MKKERAVILDRVRSVHNVGSVFRTADAAGLSRIFLCGETPAPVDRFGRPRADLAKVALGAEKSVPWSSAPSLARLLRRLKGEGWTIVAVEQSPRSASYRSAALRRLAASPKTALLFGNEVKGLDQKLLSRRDLIDAVAEIPMRGKKESLNVSVSAGIAIFGIFGL